jgi:SPP1 family predicted phage head-tail adaptor
MAIQTYFTELITVKRKTRTKVNGVMKESLDIVDEKRAAIDKATTSYAYSSDKETFTFTDVAFTPWNTDIKEDDVVEYGGFEYDVISVIDPLRRKHHKECLLNRRA